MRWAAMGMAAALAAAALQPAASAAETQKALREPQGPEQSRRAESRTQNNTATTENTTQGAQPAAEAGKAEDAEAKRKAQEEALRQAMERARTRERLQTRGSALEFDATPLAQALQMLGQAGDLSIVFDREALDAAGLDLETRPVTARLAGMTFEEALMLLLPRECGYQVGAGYIVVTTLEKSWLPLRTVVFSVRELLAEVPNFAGPRFEVKDVTSQGPGGGLFDAPPDEPEDTGQATSERLLDLVKRHVRSASDRRIAPWSDEGGPATIEYLDGKLIVSQTYEGVRAVARLLAAIQ